jgi:hypothetical protein
MVQITFLTTRLPIPAQPEPRATTTTLRPLLLHAHIRDPLDRQRPPGLGVLSC